MTTQETRGPDPRAAVQRDIARRERREVGHRSFWQSISVIGMVGWPIALGAVGGILIGRSLDDHFERPLQFTLVFLFVGVAMGSLAAWKSVVHKPRS